MAAPTHKIGEVASRMGISVRTLRHYDEIGLLKPAHRSSAGHRLYTDRDLARLQKIVALRKMGFSLEHIRAVVFGNMAEAYKTLEGKADRLREQISQLQDALKRVETALDFREMHHQFTKSEIDDMKTRSAEIRASLVSEMKRGTDPKAPRVQELVEQMAHLGQEMLKLFGGFGKFTERMEFFKNNRHLIPQGDQRLQDVMNEKIRSPEARKFFEYIKRAKG
jgi:DNA-binding transcriptional MerR regulator